MSQQVRLLLSNTCVQLNEIVIYSHIDRWTVGNVIVNLIGEAAEHSDDSVDSLSSSDGSLLDADADFASAVARAAQLSGLTVVGSTVINDNAAARHNMAPSKDKGRPKKRRERAKRPTSPYSTDSNYSSIVVPHKPYPKADRRRQLEQQKGRAGSDKRSRPAPVAKPPNLPSAPKPNLPPATRAKPGKSC